MDNALTLTITPLQSVIFLAFQIWIFVVFPIIIIRKLNYLTGLLEAQFEVEEESTNSGNE